MKFKSINKYLTRIEVAGQTFIMRDWSVGETVDNSRKEIWIEGDRDSSVYFTGNGAYSNCLNFIREFVN